MMDAVNGNNNPLAQLKGVNATDNQEPKSKSELGQTEFLKLLISQISHQNPLEPQDQGQFVTQMAQFGTVEGIRNIEQSILNLANSMQSNQALQASALVGRKVQVSGNQVNFDGNNPAKATVEVSNTTPNLQINIFDSNGTLVRNIKLGQQGAGQVPLQWDGKNNNGQTLTGGNYLIQATGLIDGEMKALPTLVSANVDSVKLGKTAAEMRLNLSGIGQVGLDAVKELQ